MNPKRLLLFSIALWCISPIAGGARLGEAAPPIRIMPLGDSITYDQYIGDLRDASERTGYRQQLWLLLQAAGYSVDFVGSRRAGWEAVPDFDPDNEGHPGWRDDEIADEVYGWLESHPADIVLLHIGTNALDDNPYDVKNILDEIDRYEINYGASVTVFLARIINRAPPGPETTLFNANVAAMALDRVAYPANPAYPDKIEMVDMENGAGLDYEIDGSSPYDDGDMYDYLHPNVSGYEKMAQAWFDSLAGRLGAAGRGSITIVNATQPPGGTGFGFAGDLGAFVLSDGQSRAFGGLEARNYRVTEYLPRGWELLSAACTGGAWSSITDGVTLHLGPAEHITCTFVNSEQVELDTGSYLDDGSGSPLHFSFASGIFSGTRFDEAAGALVLDDSALGVYTSRVFDAGRTVYWGDIEWSARIGELPNGGLADASVDMAGNVLLFHLNKDAGFGETDGLVLDFSGFGHNGAAFGAGVSIGAAGPGKFNGGYAADAADDDGRVEAASSTDFDFAATPADGFSFFLWFNKDGVCAAPDGTNEVMASRFGTADTANTWWLGCGASGGQYSNRLVFRFWALPAEDQGFLSSAAAVNDGQWHQAGWVYDPAVGEIRLYLDGQAVASAPTTPDPFTSANPLCIGAYGSSCDSYEFVGGLDEVAAFKRALAPEEASALYTRGMIGLNLEVRACDDPACDGESFLDFADASPQPLSLAGRYFQYRFVFAAPSAAESPELHKVTIRHRVLPAPDIDADGDVDGSDLHLLLLSYGKSSGSQGFDARCDLAPDGVVDAADLHAFAAAFGG